MNLTEFRRLLDDYLKGNLKKERQELLQRWYDSFGQSEKGVPGIGTSEESRLKTELLHRIQIRIDREDVRRPFFPWLRLVAAMFIILSAAGVYLVSKRSSPTSDVVKKSATFQSAHTASVQMKRVLLPDSSVVFLNANSSIRFSSGSSNSLRLFYLDRGEVFFEVKKDKRRPFIIHAGGLEVKVLGTSFNISAYPKLKEVKVAVNTGTVSVMDEGSSSFILRADDKLTYDKQQRISTLSHSKKNSHDWLKGQIVLEDASLEELTQAMLNIYGVNISTKLAEAKNYTYNLTIRSTRSVEETMTLVCAIHNNKYRRTGNDILIH